MLNISSKSFWDTTSCTVIHEERNKTTFSCNFANYNIGNEQFNCIEILSVDFLLFLKNVTLLVRSGKSEFNFSVQANETFRIFEDDYCGFPAVPVNGSVKMINATEYENSCYDGFQYNGAHRSTCDPKTGQWTPPPTCRPPDCGQTVLVFTEAASIVTLMLSIYLLCFYSR